MICYLYDEYQGDNVLIKSVSFVSQIAVGTDDVYKTAAAVREAGGTIVREPGPLPILNTKIAACLDPDGWKSVSRIFHINGKALLFLLSSDWFLSFSLNGRFHLHILNSWQW